jgi:hypothetical protein
MDKRKGIEDKVKDNIIDRAGFNPAFFIIFIGTNEPTNRKSTSTKSMGS